MRRQKFILGLAASLAMAMAGLACASDRTTKKPDRARAGTKQERVAPLAPAQKDCRAHADCPSGVCSHYKADNGFCAPETCWPGERADNNHFYCAESGLWQKSRAEGEACDRHYQCFQPSCYMNPNCDAMPKQAASCKAGRCNLDALPDACTAQGKVRVLAPEEFTGQADGQCMESMAQRVLRTVCIPCGNGICDENESICNCPQDCKQK